MNNKIDRINRVIFSCMNIHVIIAPLPSEIFFTFAKNHFKIIREED